MKLTPIFLVVLLSFAYGAAGQSTIVDSLKRYRQNRALNERGKIDVINELAYHVRKESWDTAFHYANEALTMATRSGYPRGQAFAMLTMASYYLVNSKYETSLEKGLAARQIFENENDPKGLMRSSLELGILYRHLNELKTAKAYYQKSIPYSIQLNDREETARAYNGLGVVAQSIGELDSSMIFFSKALSYLTDHEPHIKATALSSLASLYLQRNEPDAALPLLMNALRINETIGDKHGLADIHIQLGKLRSNGGDLPEAERHLLTAEKLSKEVKYDQYRLDVYEEFTRLSLKRNDFKAAFDYTVKHNAIKDSLFNTTKAQQIAAIASRHEVEKKNQTIKLLEQEQRIQSIWRGALIVGVVFASFSALWIFLLQRSRTQRARKLLEMQELLNERLTDMDKMKTQFFANISHEFRTPLTLILAPVENELKKKSGADGKESLLLIKRSANRLLELVNQLLDLSRLESGKMELQMNQGNLYSHLSVIAASFDSLAQSKEIDFIKMISLAQEPKWYDPDKIEKITTNLLSNAFKFTPMHGKVTLNCSEQNDVLSIVVSDTGQGIPVEEQANVFSTFYQTRQTVASHQPGSGLGLSLVKELVKLYNGSLTLQSRVGEGTSFTVSLPLAKSAFALRQIADTDSKQSPTSVSAHQEEYTWGELSGSNNTQGDRILVVEDNEDMRNFIAATLRNHHYAVLLAKDGVDALQAVIKYEPSLVLTDLMMPNMNGIELTRLLKNDERTRHIPVILLTAKHEMPSRIEGMNAAVDDYLTKPFLSDELVLCIANLIEMGKGSQTNLEKPSRKSSR